MKSIVEEGRRLPSTAKILAVDAYTQFLDEYPIIEQVNPKHWDFIMTIAGIFVGVSQLNHENISEQEKDVVLNVVTDSAIELYPDSIEACDDCGDFVDRTYDGLKEEKLYQDNSQFLFSDSLGTWVIWNLFGHAPSSGDERKLVRVLGGLLVHSFISWWK